VKPFTYNHNDLAKHLKGRVGVKFLKNKNVYIGENPKRSQKFSSKMSFFGQKKYSIEGRGYI
jgi:hypothetical protein